MAALVLPVLKSRVLFGGEAFAVSKLATVSSALADRRVR